VIGAALAALFPAAQFALSTSGCIDSATLVTDGAGGAGVGGSGGSVTTTGNCDQCPGDDTTCRFRTCAADTCGFGFAEASTTCAESGGKLCDGVGNCVECITASDCPNNDQCLSNVCGTLRQAGEPCATDAQCVTNSCSAEDQLCCDSACDGPCESCVGADTCGQDGTCAPVTAGTDPASECSTGACFGGACADGNIVFVTSEIYNGNLGGLTGADALCQARATAGCLSGSYMAWLSTAADSPSTRFTQHSTPYLLVDGSQIASNWADLTDGLIDHAVNLDELGAAAPLSQLSGNCVPETVWSGTSPDGTAYVADSMADPTGSSNRCDDWTATVAEGTWGRSSSTTNLWSQYCTGNTGDTCQAKAPIYCFQQ
jgi:hypothetical protein